MASTGQEYCRYVTVEVYEKLKHLDEKTRAIVAELLLEPPTENWSKSFTLPRIQRVTGSKSNLSPKEVIEAAAAKASISVTISVEEGYTKVTEVDPGPLADLQMIELKSTTPAAKRVNIRNGNKYVKQAVPNNTSQHRKELTDLLLYLNKRKNFFCKASKFAIELKAVATQMNVAGELTDHALKGQLGILNTIISEPQPFYGDTRKTLRIFPRGASIVTLCRPLRKEMCKRMGWEVLDLRAAELAIVAKLWNVPSINNILMGSGSIWQYLDNQMGWSDKELFKRSIYGITFGSSVTQNRENSIVRKWKEAGKDADLAKFLKITEIADLVNARDSMIQTIESNKQIVDAFGDTHTLDNKNGRNSRSLMSCEIQSHEVKMMLGVVDIIRKANRAEVALWIHDGIAINCSGEDRRLAKLIKDCQAAINPWRALGYTTELVHETL